MVINTTTTHAGDLEPATGPFDLTFQIIPPDRN